MDYTNYEDMKYAVSHLTIMVLFISNQRTSGITFLEPCFVSYLISAKRTFNVGDFTLFFGFMQIKKLDDSEFRNAFSKSYVRV